MSLRLIQDLQAGISRRDWSSVEMAADRLRDDVELTRQILAGAGIGSLPNDYPLSGLSKEALSTPPSLSTLTSERDVGIKPLEWRKNYESEFLSFAETVVGRYRVWSHHEADGKWFWRRNDDAGGIVASEQDAKSAAQADFNQRIRSALVPSSERDALRDRVAELEGVLLDLCDAWEVPGTGKGGGRYRGNVTRAYNAARTTLYPHGDQP